MNWLTAHDLAGTARNEANGKPVAKNARLFRDSETGDVRLRLYRTDILTWHRDGSFTFYWGSWDTVITRRYVNEYLPFGRVYRNKGQTFFGYNGASVALDGSPFLVRSGDWFVSTFGTEGKGTGQGIDWKGLNERVKR